MTTVILLVISNIFMTLAWYGHLKLKGKPLLLMILMSWLIALPEYTFQVPANRIGSGTFTVTQLKIMQECITLVVFTVIAFLLFGRQPAAYVNTGKYASSHMRTQEVSHSRR